MQIYDVPQSTSLKLVKGNSSCSQCGTGVQFSYVSDGQMVTLDTGVPLLDGDGIDVLTLDKVRNLPSLFLPILAQVRSSNRGSSCTPTPSLKRQS